MTFARLQETGVEITTAEYMAGQREVLASLRRALAEARQDMRKLYDKLAGVRPEDYFNEAVKFRRLQSLESQLVAHYRRAAREIGLTVEHSAKIAISNGYYRQQYINTIGASFTGANMTVPILGPEVIDASVFGTRELWANRFGRSADYVPRSGALLRTILDEHRIRDVERLRRVLTQSLALGESFTRGSERVKQILGASASDSIRIMRTEGHRNLLAGQLAAKESAQSDGLPVRRQIVAVLDDRTRPQSAQVDGLIENDDGFFEYPGGVLVRTPGNSGVPEWDINDREAVIMIIDGVEPTARRMRDPVSGETEIISWQPFDKWARDVVGLQRNAFGQLLEV